MRRARRRITSNALIVLVCWKQKYS